MSTSSIPPLLPDDLPHGKTVGSLARFRESVAESLFAISRAFPKLLALRSTPSAWTAFRILLGAAGASLVVLPLSLWNAWAFAIVGLVFFLLAVLLPPLRQDRGATGAIAQLGAYLVLDAGRLSEGSSPATAVSFFLTPSKIWALDEELRPLVVIPANELAFATAFPVNGEWILRLGWGQNAAEFVFDGLFARRRARLAEAGLQHLVRHAGPAPARAKAAGA